MTGGRVYSLQGAGIFEIKEGGGPEGGSDTQSGPAELGRTRTGILESQCSLTCLLVRGAGAQTPKGKECKPPLTAGPATHTATPASPCHLQASVSPSAQEEVGSVTSRAPVSS